ncbi:MAG: aminotransferase class III-fold pyridoxal phosphate-dependent enzyme [Gammaproteobacteria bacterium]|nr:aminotransferase class III-fold pyridoxal phosphate-dependent enzyme [Gammaproteobacteria bacterium]
MRALRTTSADITPAQAARCGAETHGLDGEPSNLDGERDQNFSLLTSSGARHVLKFVDPADFGAAAVQAAVLRHIASRDPGLPVPRILPARSGADHVRVSIAGVSRELLVIGHLAGRRWPATGAPTPSFADLGALLARLDRALEGFFDPALARELAWDVRRLPSLAAFAGEIEDSRARDAVSDAAAAFERRLNVLNGLRSQAIHGDCHAGNLLVDDTGTAVSGILDFGDMIHAPLVLEPAVSMAEGLSEGIARIGDLAALIGGFGRELKLQSAEVDCLFDVIRARLAITILVQAWRRRHDPAGAGALAQAAPRAEEALHRLCDAGEAALTASWHEAAGTLPARAALRKRRARFLGAGAELFYREPLQLVRGADVWMFDADGRRYLDVYNNVPHVGHAHPAVVEAIRRQAATLATNTRYLHEAILDYAEQLTSRLPAGLDACLFVNSGSEANDIAWRIAQTATGRRGALIMEHAYHGITDAVTALTPAAGGAGDPRVETLRAPDEAPDLERALAALTGRGLAPAAFFLDSALTSNGILDPRPAWAAQLGAGVRASGALVVADEVQYGLGRSGSHFWGFARRGLEPDIVTLGKPVGNGFPLGVVITRRALLEEFQARCAVFSTFGGNAVAAAAGLAVLEVLERERLMENAQTTGAYFLAKLRELVSRHRAFSAARGAGLLLGLEVVDDLGRPSKPRAQRIVDALAARHGVLTGLDGPGGNVLKLRPPMTFKREHADLAAEAIDAVASAADAAAEPA